MSRSFTTRPTATNTRGRGRGTQTRNTTVARPLNEASGARPRVPGVTGRGVLHGEEMLDPSQNNDNPNPEIGQRMTYQGGYSMITPNERKRQQIAEMAKKEEDDFASHKERNTQKTFSYVGTVGGRQVTETQSRQQTIHNSPTKTGKLIAQQQRKSFVKQKEEEEMLKKKQSQRLKAQQNEERNRKDNNKWDDQRRQTNDAFLRRLEKKSNPADSGPTNNKDEDLLRTPDLPGQRCAPPTNTSRSVISRSTEENPPTEGAVGGFDASSNSSIANRLTGEEQKRLNALAMIFPHIDEEILIDILQEVGFSVDTAITLLQA